MVKEIYSKDILNKCGIYQITNLVNGKIYIGSALNLNKRYNKHISDLIKNKHNNIHLQAAFNKYGADCFEWEILKIVPNDLPKKKLKNILLKHEQFFMNITGVYEFGYNATLLSSSRLGSKNVREPSESTILRRMEFGKLVSIKCLVYGFDGVFVEQFNSLIEAENFIGGTGIESAIKSISGRCKNFIVKPYIENYPLKIEPYVRKIEYPEGFLDERKTQMIEYCKNRVFTDEYRDNLREAQLKRSDIRKVLLKVDVNGNVLDKYCSMEEASKHHTLKAIYKYMDNGKFSKRIKCTFYTEKYIIENKILINHPDYEHLQTKVA